jgi:hypothetical protein
MTLRSTLRPRSGSSVRPRLFVLPRRRTGGWRRRVNRSPLLRLTLAALLAVGAMAAAGSLLSLH